MKFCLSTYFASYFWSLKIDWSNMCVLWFPGSAISNTYPYMHLSKIEGYQKRKLFISSSILYCYTKAIQVLWGKLKKKIWTFHSKLLFPRHLHFLLLWLEITDGWWWFGMLIRRCGFQLTLGRQSPLGADYHYAI